MKPQKNIIKYVLSQEYPPQIIDMDDYINIMGTEDFDRSGFSISDEISDLPDLYKNELINRLFSYYVNDGFLCLLLLDKFIKRVVLFFGRSVLNRLKP